MPAMLRRRLLLVIAGALIAALVGGSSALAGSDAKSAKNTLVVLKRDIAPSLDYDGPSASHLEVAEIIQNLQDPIVDYPRKDNGSGVLIPDYRVGQMGFEPRLAESYSRKGLVWTFKLRQGVISCAGNELTAEDVVWTWARGKSVSGASPVAWFLGNVASILPLDPLTSKDPKAKELKGEVKAIDKYTVQFTQSGPNDLFPRILEIFADYTYDSAEMKKHATAKDPWAHTYTANTNAPGFGAYCLKSWIKGSSMQLVANPKYYRGAPQYTTINIRGVPSNSNRVSAIRTGAADITDFLTPLEFDSLKSAGQVSVLSWESTGFVALGFNSTFAPWNLPNNKLIRQAIAYAMPYADVIKNDYLGKGTQMRGLCKSTYYGAVPINTYSTNVAKAKALLAKAGFPDGKGLEKYADGFNVYYIAENRGTVEPLINRIATSLKAIGITLKLNPVSQAEYTDRNLTKQDTPMFIRDQERPLGPDVGYCALLFYVSKANGGLLVPTRYENKTFDALYAKQKNQVGAARLGTLKRMQEIMMDELPLVPIAEVETQLAVRKGITGWAGQGSDRLYYWYFKGP